MKNFIIGVLIGGIVGFCCGAYGGMAAEKNDRDNQHKAYVEGMTATLDTLDKMYKHQTETEEGTEDDKTC